MKLINGKYISVLLSMAHCSNALIPAEYNTTSNNNDSMVELKLLVATIAFGLVCSTVGVLVASCARRPHDNNVAPMRDQENELEQEVPAQNITETQQSLQILENVHEKKLKKYGYKGAIPADFIDPISREIMVDPVILVTDHPTGNSLDKASAETLIKNHRPCPFSVEPIKGYVPNLFLKNTINDWVNEKKEERSKKLCELPRKAAKETLLEAQSMFNKRQPKKPREENQPLQFTRGPVQEL